MFVLISIIAIIYVGAPFGRPPETAELNKNIDKNEEQISAATATTVNAGDTYTVPKDGIYKIELHGGHGEGDGGKKGGKVTGYVSLNSGQTLTASECIGGKGAGKGGFGRGGNSIGVSIDGTLLLGARWRCWI